MRTLARSLLGGILVTLVLAWVAPVLAARVLPPTALERRELILTEVGSDEGEARVSRFFRHRGMTRARRRRHLLSDWWVVHPADPRYAPARDDVDWPDRLAVTWDELDPARSRAEFEALPRSLALPRFRDARWWRVDTGLTGWPLRAFASEAWFPTVDGVEIGAPELRWNVDLGPHPSGGPTLVPLRPIPLGLLVDVAVWSAPIWILLASLDGWRRARRRRAGRCVACGYPLGGATMCPECGARDGSARPAARIIRSA